MVFKNDENNILKTRVQAKGYGPRSQKENRVPIGGLDITISSLDELLNRMVLSQLMEKKIQFHLLLKEAHVLKLLWRQQ
jgi:hypothetical protein